MKAQVKRHALLETLGIVKSVVPGKSTLPILTNILLQAKDGQLTLTGTDLENALISSCKAKVEKSGAMAIPPALLESFLKQVQDESISIESKGKVVAIQAGAVRSTLPVLPAQDFPPIPKVKKGKGFMLANLEKGLKEVSYAMAKDESRPVLHGIYLSQSGNKVELAAADGFRLAITSVPGKGLPERVILSAETVLLLLKTMKGQVEGDYQKDDEERAILSLRQNETTLITHAVSGNFPNYQQLVPKKGKLIKVSTDSLKNALKIVMVAKPSKDKVDLRTKGQSLVVSGRNNDTEQSTESTIPVKGRGKIAFNGKFLSDILSRSGEMVELRITNPQSPGVVRQNGTIHVLMPMFNQW